MPTRRSYTDVKAFIRSEIQLGDCDDSFLILDLTDIERKLVTWQRLLPRITPFYAVKCNNAQPVVRKMVNLGVKFDCASIAEIEQVLDAGSTADCIIYANPCKQISYLRKAENLGVSLTTVDSVDEIIKIKNHAPSFAVLLRLATDDSNALCRLSDKFGAHLRDVEEILSKAKSLEIEVKGFAFHVGSSCADKNAFAEAVRVTRKALEIAHELGFDPKIIDVGGGFPGDSVDDLSGSKKSCRSKFDLMAQTLGKALDVHFPENEGFEIIAEPGRYFVASCGTLLTSVIGRKIISKGQDDKHICYYLGDGVYGSLNNTLHDHAVVMPEILCPEESEKSDEEFESSVWGPTCDSLDCIVKKAIMPKMEVGTWVYFNNMGAYTICASSTFNGFSKPRIKLIGSC